MTSKDIYRLLRKHLTNEISKKELEQLQQWRDESEHNRMVFETMKKVWAEASEEPELINTEDVIDKIWSKGVEHDRNRFRKIDWNYWARIAATFIIFVTAIVVVLQFNREEPQKSVLSYTVKECPAGQKMVTLPDGSTVWLNGSSKILYAETYNDSARIVELDGEAFFEVKKDPDHPFIVKSGALQTTALGTSFNVNAFKEEDDIKVSLFAGKVAINDGDREVILLPGNEIYYDKETQNVVERPFDAREVNGWKNGLLIFKGDGYYEVIRKLERWFGMKISTVGRPPDNWRLTTTYQNESLVNILKNIHFGKSFNYQLRNDSLTIIFGYI